MKYFLDTSVCIDALKGRHPQIEARLRTLSPAVVKIAAIVKAELLLGAEKSADSKRTRELISAFLFPFEIVPFDDRAAAHHVRIRHQLEDAGTPIGPNDLLLAASVLAEDGILVSHNTREFRRVEKLRVEDWVGESTG